MRIETRTSDRQLDFRSASFDGMFDFFSLQRISKQLADKDLINWHQMASGGDVTGYASLTGDGADVVEGTRPSPVSITLDQSSNITVSGSQNVAVGNNNSQ